MKKCKPEPGTAEYAPNRVRRQHTAEEEGDRHNEPIARDVLEEAREYLKQRGITQSRGKMTRIPATLQTGSHHHGRRQRHPPNPHQEPHFRRRGTRTGVLTGHEAVPEFHQGGDVGPRCIAGTGSDSAFAARTAVCLAGGVGSEMGPCRLRGS